jgi:hypothetical protein
MGLLHALANVCHLVDTMFSLKMYFSVVQRGHRLRKSFGKIYCGVQR